MPGIKTLCCQTAFALLASVMVANAATTQIHPFQTNADEFLPPDEAFRISVVRDGDDYAARWQIADEYYLYREKIKMGTATADVAPRIPPGILMRDEFFGETDVFRHFVEVPFTLSPATGEPIVSITYQGCADAGLCYPPVTKRIDLSSLSLAAANTSANVATTAGLPSRGAPVSKQFMILERLRNDHLIAVLLAFLGFGLLLSLTPCVLPMVPILSGIIARSGEGEEKPSTKRTFALSLSYVLSMSITYSLFGVAMGLTGESLQIWLQQPWVVGAFALVFVALALSMFGLYDLQIPSSVQTRLHAFGNHRDGKRSSLPGAAVMGSVSALIVSPCVTAPLIGALLFIAQTGDAVLGALALFSLAFGMGIPLLIVGTSLGHLLPQPGAMLDTVKPVFGLLMLGVSIWLLDRVTSPVVTLWSGGALLVLTANYLHQMVKHGAFNFGGKVLMQGLAVVALLYGALLITGAATGGSSLLRPLEHLAVAPAGGATAQKQTLAFKQIYSLRELQSEIARAEQFGQGVMLDFYADWCVVCKEMEAFTFSDGRVKTATTGITLLQADVTENNDNSEELLNHFGLFGPPAILFFDIHGYEIPSARVVGYMNADDFTHHLNQVFSVRRT